MEPSKGSDLRCSYWMPMHFSLQPLPKNMLHGGNMHSTNGIYSFSSLQTLSHHSKVPSAECLLLITLIRTAFVYSTSRPIMTNVTIAGRQDAYRFHLRASHLRIVNSVTEHWLSKHGVTWCAVATWEAVAKKDVPYCRIHTEKASLECMPHTPRGTSMW